ncbi:LuxR C-terminal-related transcriptional regulator [Lentisalinibacter orientalis]|uniref:LuxR C-terminal-related transcriptional regulator n=1 Tax=Lentisalinibacter orientalis TaxID=2992241 RepID=UPI0038633898
MNETPVADWVIASKLAPSVRLRQPVGRDGLLSRLDEILTARAGLVHAPAGCGKSAVLAEWRESLLSRSIPVAWYSLDEYDQDPFQFLTYLTEACRAAGFSAGFEFPDSRQGFSNSPSVAVRAAVVTALGRCRGPHVIILDDFHRADAPEVRDLVHMLLADLPEDIHLVISAREYPEKLSLADLRMREALVEVDQADLRFSVAEIESFLGSLVQPGVRAGWAEELFERTEGWPVALQTVRLWLAEGATMEDTLREVSGRSSDLVDYFLEQVLNNLGAEEQRFLLRTSILERVNGELGDLLCGRHDSWQILERLERRDQFVHALDRDRAWYRYHRLFSEFLQERLRRQSEAQLRELHGMAAGWFGEHGHTQEAVQHALGSGDPERIAGLLESLGGWHYALLGHVGIVEHAMSKIPAEVTQRYPRVWLARMFLTARVGEVAAAEREFGEFAARHLNDPSTDRQLECEGRLMESLLARYGDRDIGESEVRKLEQLGETLANDNHVMKAVCYNLLCALYGRTGRLDEAMAAGDQAIMHFRRMGSQWGEVFIYFHEGCACMAQARLRDAEALYREGYELAVENFGAGHDSAAIGRAFLAEVEYEKNNLYAAGQLVEEALAHIERFDAWFDVYLAAYSTALKIARARRDAAAQQNIVRRAKSTAVNRGITRLALAIDLLQAGYGELPPGDGGNAGAAQDHNGSTDPVMHHLHIWRAGRALLAAGEYDRAARLLAPEADRARRRRHHRSLITLSLLLAAALWKLGRQEEAHAAFEAALAPALFEGLKRPFLDESDVLADVIAELAAASERRRGNRLRDVFLTELATEMRSAARRPGEPESALSPREQEVLRFLIQGRSNREIADAMDLSINTVKFHMKNIFGKLGVNSRKDAVSATIRRRLL